MSQIHSKNWINSSLIWQDLSTYRITNDICSVLEQSLTSSAKIEKTLDSFTSEIMPVTISSPHKQIYSFCIDLDMYFALLGAFKMFFF